MFKNWIFRMLNREEPTSSNTAFTHRAGSADPRSPEAFSRKRNQATTLHCLTALRPFPSVTRFQLYKEKSPELFFWKDTKFKYQNEYRLVIPDTSVKGPLTIQIDDMSEYSRIVGADELLTGQLTFVVGKKDV